ncbi:Os01g0175666 [Oryza sativa Japonica Group]|uniref:Os01g0175666 protein n=1 Tax=Oryza sativa subsp. japonica TaxID=39947 RepID=A0A0P0UYY4_ORYSJ|nr:Os01g0175666 [Oryza sativa Japonica Group]
MVTCTDRCVIVSFPLPPRHPLLQGTATYAARPKARPSPPPAAAAGTADVGFSSNQQAKRNEQLLLTSLRCQNEKKLWRSKLQELFVEMLTHLPRCIDEKQ